MYIHTGSRVMHIHHNICTVHWLEGSPPKVIYQPNCECEVPLMTKEVLYGIGLPLHVPLPHAVWMMPQMGVLCDGVRLVLQAPNRYYYCINGQTTAVSSLTTLIKECFECTCIYVFSLQYIVACMYPLYWTGVSCGLILVLFKCGSDMTQQCVCMLYMAHTHY